MSDLNLDLPVTLPDALLDRIAEAVAERVVERIDLSPLQSEPEPFVDTATAAAFLGFAGNASKHMSEFGRGRRLPRRTDRGRLLFLRSELRAMVEKGAAG